jgi:hypothetical protein
MGILSRCTCEFDDLVVKPTPYQRPCRYDILERVSNALNFMCTRGKDLKVFQLNAKHFDAYKEFLGCKFTPVLHTMCGRVEIVLWP